MEEETRRKAEEARKKAEALKKTKSSYSLSGSEIPSNSVETLPLPGTTSSNPINSPTSSSNINPDGTYSMKTNDLIDVETIMPF